MKVASNKISQVIVTLFLGAIIVAFVLTGFEGFSGSSDAVATVDGNPVKINEYRRALDNQINRYTQMFGGKTLTNQQIRQFGIKENVLRGLVEQKMMLNFAQESLKVHPSTQEIKEEIKNSEFFQTNKQFDVTRYRALLASNGFTPSKYEEVVIDQIRGEKLSQFLGSIQPSEVFAKEILEFKNQKAKVYAVSFSKEAMTKHLDIAPKEINDFAANKENEAKLSALYKAADAEFNKPEKIKARHILLKVEKGEDAKVLAQIKDIKKGLTKSNFKKIASEKTQDPSGKSNGGDLGEFSKGRMVPEFDKVAFSLKPGEISAPVKTQFGYHLILVEGKTAASTKSLASVKNILSKRHLQKIKRQELEKFNADLKENLQALLKESKFSEVEALAKKYDLNFEKSIEVNAYDLKVGTIEFDEEKVSKIILGEDKNTVVLQEDATKIALLKASSFTQSVYKDELVEQEVASLKSIQEKELSEKILGALREKSKVVTYSNLL